MALIEHSAVAFFGTVVPGDQLADRAGECFWLVAHDQGLAVGISTSLPPGARLAYSVDEVAQVTGLSRDLLYDEMRGRFAYLKVGRRRIITRQQLGAFLSKQD